MEAVARSSEEAVEAAAVEAARPPKVSRQGVEVVEAPQMAAPQMAEDNAGEADQEEAGGRCHPLDEREAVAQ